MTDIAIRVDNLSKLYYLGAVHQRPDTTSAVLSAGLRDALTGIVPRISQITRIKDRKNPSNPSNPWQAPASPDDLWALKDVSFEACPPWTQPSAGLREFLRRIKRGEMVDTRVRAVEATLASRFSPRYN